MKNLGEAAKVDMEPKFIGRHLSMVISPTRVKIENKENAKTKN
jgi:hypothetical protein